jgi:dCTP deaminase
METGQPTLFPALALEPLLHTTGILPSQKIREFIEAGYISAAIPIEADQIQPASLDLRLGQVAYRVRASFLPGPRSTVLHKAESLITHEIDLTRPAVLERECVYIIPLMEEWYLPAQVGWSPLSGKANPKSTTGRLDVFVRLITDYATEFERVPAGYKGRLYVEVVPHTFSVLIQAGTRLNQLRFIRGTPPPADSRVSELHERQVLLYLEDGAVREPTIADGLWVSVDLDGAHGSEIIGYRAKAHAPLLDFNREDFYDPWEFWDPIVRPKGERLILNPEDFYLLASKERVRIPVQAAAEMVGYDPSVGEFRTHYAGFFDPGFGYGSDDIRGTPAVLEVRSHEVPFVLEDGQRIGRLVFEQLLAIPDRIYGAAIGSSYQRQALALSKQFKQTV